MTTGIAAFRIALAQALSFGLSPAPGMIWATHAELAPEADQGAAKEKMNVPRGSLVHAAD